MIVKGDALPSSSPSSPSAVEGPPARTLEDDIADLGNSDPLSPPLPYVSVSRYLPFSSHFLVLFVLIFDFLTVVVV